MAFLSLLNVLGQQSGISKITKKICQTFHVKVSILDETFGSERSLQVYLCCSKSILFEKSWFFCCFLLYGWITTFPQEEPKKVRFDYDLFLHLEGHPPVNHLRCEKLTFNNPTEEFRRKLLKAGGVGFVRGEAGTWVILLNATHIHYFFRKSQCNSVPSFRRHYISYIYVALHGHIGLTYCSCGLYIIFNSPVPSLSSKINRLI